MAALRQAHPNVLDRPRFLSKVLEAARLGDCSILSCLLSANSKLAEACDEHGNVGSYFFSRHAWSDLRDLSPVLLKQILVHESLLANGKYASGLGSFFHRLCYEENDTPIDERKSMYSLVVDSIKCNVLHCLQTNRTG